MEHFRKVDPAPLDNTGGTYLRREFLLKAAWHVPIDPLVICRIFLHKSDSEEHKRNVYCGESMVSPNLIQTLLDIFLGLMSRGRREFQSHVCV